MVGAGGVLLPKQHSCVPRDSLGGCGVCGRGMRACQEVPWSGLAALPFTLPWTAEAAKPVCHAWACPSRAGAGTEPPSQCPVEGSSAATRQHSLPVGSCSRSLWLRATLLFVSWWQPQSWVGGGWAVVLVSNTFRWQDWHQAVMAVAAQVPSGSTFTFNEWGQ